jgi:addiction module RelB/DinJ family antitoxin
MTEQVHYRIDRDLVKRAYRICRELNLSPSQAVTMFFGQMVRSGGLPFRPSTFPALEEYGVTPAQAETALAKATDYLERERKAGQLIEFKGKLP